MTRSGHSQETKGRIFNRGLQIYSNKLRDHKEGVRNMHRRARDSLGDRRLKRLTIGKNWFKPKTNMGTTNPNTRKPRPNKTTNNNTNRTPDTALFVPRTPGGGV